MASFEISGDYLLQTLQDLIETPSPTGDTDWVSGYVQQELESLGLPAFRTVKGAIVGTFDGLRKDKPRALTAHVDTLGAMVAGIKPNGRIRLTAVNGVNWPSVESEGVTIHSSTGRQFRGSIVLANGGTHVNKEARTRERNEETLELRIDERTSSAEETRMLGIDVGDYVYFDPRFEATEAGFVRSRFLDDKACVACLLAAVKAMKETKVSPVQETYVLFSNYEEVLHGGRDGLPDNLYELVVLDMACVGENQAGDEMHCSICVKDASGPYSKGLTEKLRGIAASAGVDLIPDIYPYYRSDGSMYWSSGGQAQVALIGPGVDTSHGYERTHREALMDTASLIAEYLISD